MPVLLAGGGTLIVCMPDRRMSRTSSSSVPMVLVGDSHWNSGTFPSKKSSTGNSAESMMRP